ncbi:MAG: 50S ribosomal protein L17 [Flavobacteriales bacterium]|jgi:large subunit ribosomal protein L17|nr:50S ribosomal protein L17 [Flavobacteriales bacterium]MBK6550465.1 50S ribosomal protein L17 [Flavobacteriales bacterium]MBK6882987.1 50S ribosomal protein L17 [Flavobacteriales bacterium]MBK7114324.1 50S ribosomal protein L17 [Flavobacteriales bacterium]MBK7483615.1 50S ribosomal protein L17 [Flavobacteriales bacterium]
MRHGNKNNALGRKKAHRDSLLSNLAISLIDHKRIETTLAKAKALRLYVEPLITKSKEDTTHSRRMVFSELQNKEATAALFRDVAPKIASRPGGYTRIIKLGNRLGDAAEMAMIELVDFNTTYTKETSTGAAKKTRRTRRTSAKTTAPKDDAPAADAPEEPKAE